LENSVYEPDASGGKSKNGRRSMAFENAVTSPSRIGNAIKIERCTRLCVFSIQRPNARISRRSNRRSRVRVVRSRSRARWSIVAIQPIPPRTQKALAKPTAVES
jgi:hypothetical protein